VSEIQAALAGGIGGCKKRGWGREGDLRPHAVVAMGPDRHHPLKLPLSCWFRQSATLLWTPHSGGRLARPQCAARIVQSEDAGHGESGRRWLTAAGASRWQENSASLSVDGKEPP